MDSQLGLASLKPLEVPSAQRAGMLLQHKMSCSRMSRSRSLRVKVSPGDRVLWDHFKQFLSGTDLMRVCVGGGRGGWVNNGVKVQIDIQWLSRGTLGLYEIPQGSTFTV